MLKTAPNIDDRETILNACIASFALKAGDAWLRRSARAVKGLGTKAREPIAVFYKCLIEKMIKIYFSSPMTRFKPKHCSAGFSSSAAKRSSSSDGMSMKNGTSK